MKKVKLKCQILAFSMMLLVGATSMAPEASAQTDGFFSGWNSIPNGDVNGYSNGETDWNQINAQDPTNADLDGGLLILLAAGTGYLLIKRKQKLLTKFKSVEK